MKAIVVENLINKEEDADFRIELIAENRQNNAILKKLISRFEQGKVRIALGYSTGDIIGIIYLDCLNQ